MIGLGSNRLTVCRRGGMSVTQAGRGGMEWLAGGRMPDWVTPYSAQATAALKAQFQTQWPTIRDYGWQYPALVPFINEDPMLVMSLIEGLGTRWLVGDGTAYINSGWTPKESNFEIQTRYTYTSLSSTNMALYANEWNNGNGLVFMYGTNKGYIQTSTSIQRNVDLGVTAGADVTMSHKVNQVKTIIGGVEKTSNTGISSINNTKPLWIYGKQNGADLFFSGKLAYWKLLFGTTEQMNLVPCKNPNGNDYGMLDAVHAVFYPNANSSGSFTISESPAS